MKTSGQNSVKINNDDVYERLLRFKLTKPVECVLSVENAVTVTELMQLADEIMSANSAIATALSSINADCVATRLLGEMRLGATEGLMLSMQRNESGRLRHAMVVALISAGLGYQAQLPAVQMSALLSAAMLHDVGEFYISPDIFAKSDSLTHAERRQVMSHPLVGATVIRTTMNFSPETSHYVLEHHERLSGYGYPRQVSGKLLSTPGAFLGVAEVAAAILAEEEVDLDRLGNVLKLIPGEFPPFAVSIMDAAYHAMQSVLGVRPEQLVGENIKDTANLLESSLMAAEQWVDAKRADGEIEPSVADFVRSRLTALLKTGHSAGLFGYSHTAPGVGYDARERAERLSVCNESRTHG